MPPSPLLLLPKQVSLISTSISQHFYYDLVQRNSPSVRQLKKKAKRDPSDIIVPAIQHYLPEQAGHLQTRRIKSRNVPVQRSRLSSTLWQLKKSSTFKVGHSEAIKKEQSIFYAFEKMDACWTSLLQIFVLTGNFMDITQPIEHHWQSSLRLGYSHGEAFFPQAEQYGVC